MSGQQSLAGADGSPMRLEPLPTELRPTSALLTYYFLSSLAAGPFFIFPLAPLYFRYRTLRYRIDDEGITMRWGALFRREVSLNYARIQDIHLSSNLVERWLGLGKIQVQTASGSAKAEMTIEGVRALNGMRDFLYSRMRGARGEAPASGDGAGREVPAGPVAGTRTAEPEDELTRTLRAIAAEVRSLRQELTTRDRGDGRA